MYAEALYDCTDFGIGHSSWHMGKVGGGVAPLLCVSQPGYSLGKMLLCGTVIRDVTMVWKGWDRGSGEYSTPEMTSCQAQSEGCQE